MVAQRRFADLFYNAVTYLGVLTSLMVFIIEVFLFAIDFFSGTANLYLGLITYLVLPGVLLFGLALIPLGVWWKRRRLQRGIPQPELRSFRVDLAIPAHRNALLVFIVGTAILVLMSLVGSYQAYHYTESVPFCGTLCHTVMKPEYTTYLTSPHGKVACVDCHIGPGAGWFVKSKLSGLRQVWRTMLSSYARPIATPIRNLRPAEETCLQCHWPGKFFSTIDLRRTYYLPEKDNKEWSIRMSLNVGGGDAGNYGVHAHMNIDRDIYYASEDKERDNLSWVKSVDKNGKEETFVTKDSRFRNSPPPVTEIRKMDCIDCHNRPSHRFLPANALVDRAMEDGRIAPGLPDIREQGVKVLSKEYAGDEQAFEDIGKDIESYYQSSHPELADSMRAQIGQAVSSLREIYSTNIFPYMKARWDVHPDHIGHMNSRGCFRCHDNRHKNGDGKAISRECQSCHLIIEQGPADKLEKNLDGLEFRHPDDEEEWKTMACTECHTGAE